MAVTGSGRVPEVCLNKLAGLCEFSFEKNARLTVDKAFRCLLHATKTIRQKSMSSLLWNRSSSQFAWIRGLAQHPGASGWILKGPEKIPCKQGAQVSNHMGIHNRICGMHSFTTTLKSEEGGFRDVGLAELFRVLEGQGS